MKGGSLKARPDSTRRLRPKRQPYRSILPRKVDARRSSRPGPVPQTDTGGRVEHTEALERFTVKELGKLAP